MTKKIEKNMVLLIFFLISPKIYSMGFTEIKINYKHSLRIPYNSINMEINQNKIFVKVASMEGHTGYDYSNFEREITITKEYFEIIYQRFLNINYNGKVRYAGRRRNDAC
jgi:hypothetical protein